MLVSCVLLIGTSVVVRSLCRSDSVTALRMKATSSISFSRPTRASQTSRTRLSLHKTRTLQRALFSIVSLRTRVTTPRRRHRRRPTRLFRRSRRFCSRGKSASTSAGSRRSAPRPSGSPTRRRDLSNSRKTSACKSSSASATRACWSADEVEPLRRFKPSFAGQSQITNDDRL